MYVIQRSVTYKGESEPTTTFYLGDTFGFDEFGSIKDAKLYHRIKDVRRELIRLRRKRPGKSITYIAVEI